jgi:hypothetical protein
LRGDDVGECGLHPAVSGEIDRLSTYADSLAGAMKLVKATLMASIAFSRYCNDLRQTAAR